MVFLLVELDGIASSQQYGRTETNLADKMKNLRLRPLGQSCGKNFPGPLSGRSMSLHSRHPLSDLPGENDQEEARDGGHNDNLQILAGHLVHSLGLKAARNQAGDKVAK